MLARASVLSLLRLVALLAYYDYSVVRSRTLAQAGVRRMSRVALTGGVEGPGAYGRPNVQPHLESIWPLVEPRLVLLPPNGRRRVTQVGPTREEVSRKAHLPAMGKETP
jgi:hypothetical protein